MKSSNNGDDELEEFKVEFTGLNNELFHKCKSPSCCCLNKYRACNSDSRILSAEESNLTLETPVWNMLLKSASEINDDDEKREENGEEVPLIEAEFGEGDMACVSADSVPEFIIIIVVNLKGGAFRGGLGCWWRWSFVLVN